MGNSESNQKKYQSELVKTSCHSCLVNNDQDAKFCKKCGVILQTHQLTDAELAKKQSEKYQRINCNLIYNEIPNGLFGIQNNILKLQKQIQPHRKTCWDFGFSGYDYGDIWSSTSYWHSLITSNKKICTDNMHFQTKQSSCLNCKQTVRELQEVKRQWENKVIHKYYFLKNSK